MSFMTTEFEQKQTHHFCFKIMSLNRILKGVY
jgi:hypothetical protein